MRTATTIAFLRDGTTRTIHGPEVAIPTQEETLRRFLRDPFSADIAEAQLWISDSGMVKRAQLRKPIKTEQPTETKKKKN